MSSSLGKQLLCHPQLSLVLMGCLLLKDTLNAFSLSCIDAYDNLMAFVCDEALEYIALEMFGRPWSSVGDDPAGGDGGRPAFRPMRNKNLPTGQDESRKRIKLLLTLEPNSMLLSGFSWRICEILGKSLSHLVGDADPSANDGVRQVIYGDEEFAARCQWVQLLPLRESPGVGTAFFFGVSGTLRPHHELRYRSQGPFHAAQVNVVVAKQFDVPMVLMMKSRDVSQNTDSSSGDGLKRNDTGGGGRDSVVFFCSPSSLKDDLGRYAEAVPTQSIFHLLTHCDTEALQPHDISVARAEGVPGAEVAAPDRAKVGVELHFYLSGKVAGTGFFMPVLKHMPLSFKDDTQESFQESTFPWMRWGAEARKSHAMPPYGAEETIPLIQSVTIHSKRGELVDRRKPSQQGLTVSDLRCVMDKTGLALFTHLKEVDLSHIYHCHDIGTHFLCAKPFLTSVRLPQGLVDIGHGFCAQCPELTAMDFSGSTRTLKSIGSNVLFECAKLQSVLLYYSPPVEAPTSLPETTEQQSASNSTTTTPLANLVAIGANFCRDCPRLTNIPLLDFQDGRWKKHPTFGSDFLRGCGISEAELPKWVLSTWTRKKKGRQLGGYELGSY